MMVAKAATALSALIRKSRSRRRYRYFIALPA
jgi:hypothetical protein